MKKIKLAVIGTGMAFERLHYPALARMKDKYEIVAVCDKDINKARTAASNIGLPVDKAYYDYETMLTSIEADAVDVMVPISENYEVAKAVIKKGFHLIAEKPFASTIEAAKELDKISKKNNVKVLVAENYRYEEENKIMKNLISQGAIGDIVYFIDNKITDFTEDIKKDTFASREWRQHPEFGGGIFLDSGVHNIARLRFLFGNVETVFATGSSFGAEFSPYNCINALLTFANNVSGHYSYFNAGKESQAPLVGLRIFGTEGEIYLEQKECGCINVTYKDGRSQQIYYKTDEGYYNELLNFYNALTNDEEIVSNPEKELGDIQTVYDILKSIETGKSVSATNNFKAKIFS